MNGLSSIFHRPEAGELTIYGFRKAQYNHFLFYNIFLNIINYLNRLRGDYYTLKDIKITENVSYGATTEKLTFRLLVECENEEHEFLLLDVPKLISDIYFIIDGNYYIPSLFIIDYPIFYNKVGFGINGLFNSIYFGKNGFLRFMGRHVPILYFLEFYLRELGDDYVQLFEEVVHLFKMANTKRKVAQREAKEFLESHFGFRDWEEFDEILTKMIFDDFTAAVYSECYGLVTVTFREVLKLALTDILGGSPPSFIDLNYKRLAFMEIIFFSFCKIIGAIARNIVTDSIYTRKVDVDRSYLISFFKNDLRGTYLYDGANLYDATIACKATWKLPWKENLPNIAASIHPSHYGRICPVTVSARDVGETVTFYPRTRVSLFGKFL